MAATAADIGQYPRQKEGRKSGASYICLFYQGNKIFPGNPLNKFLFLSRWSVLCYMAITGGKGSWKSQSAEFPVFKFESSKG